MKTNTKTRNPRAKKRVAKSLALNPKYVLRRDVKRDHDAFLAALNQAIEFHRTNQDDPYGIDVAVMAALIEIRDAFKVYIY